jgi:hypothetical protein
LFSFPAIEVDESDLYKIAKASFTNYVKNLLNEDRVEFEGIFGKYQLEDLKTVLTKVQYTKYMHEQDLIYFDQSTKFHFEVKLHVFSLDEDGDKITLAGYLLVLNSNFELVDDFLS